MTLEGHAYGGSAAVLSQSHTTYNSIQLEESLMVWWDCTHLMRFYSCPGGGGGGRVLSPFDGGGVWPEKKYRGVRELLFIPKKGGLENRNKHRPKAGVNGGRRQSWGGGGCGRWCPPHARGVWGAFLLFRCSVVQSETFRAQIQEF